MAERIINLNSSFKARQVYEKLKRMYRNDWKADLDQRLKEQYIDEVYQRFAKLKDVSVNIFRTIIRRICSVYKKPAIRQLVTMAGEEVESQEWEDWKTESKLDVIMQEAHRLSKACTICYLHIRTSEEKGKILLHVYTPDQVHVELDPEDNITPVSISYLFTVKKKQKESQYWVYYSKENRYFLNQNGEKLDTDPRTGESYDQENIYGIIPIIPFPAEIPVVDYYNEHWNENAYEANITIGVTKTRVNNLIKFQTHKQIWLGGDVDEKTKNAIIDEAVALILGEGGQAGILDLTSGSLDSLTKHIQQSIITIAEEFGISPDNFVATGNVQSGFALKIKSQSLEEIREADLPICQMVEKQLFETVRVINNTDFSDHVIPEDAVLKFNPGEITFPEPWPEEQQKWEFRFVHGLANEIDFLRSEDPELTREDAEKKLITIQDENKRLKPVKSWAEQILEREKLKQGQKGQEEGAANG